MKWEIAKLQISFGKPLSLQQTNKKIQDYIQTCQSTPTYIGLLNYLGITREEANELQYNPSQEQKKIWRSLQMFKQALEEQMEKALLYQNVENKNYNYNALMFYMKKHNPNQYGDKVIEIKQTKSKTNELLQELSNESGVDIFDKCIKQSN